MSTLWVLGGWNIDQVLAVPRIPRPGETVVADEPRAREAFGGKGGNQAVAAALAGARVRALAAVGDDAPGRRYVDRMRALGIDVDGVGVDPDLPTGRAVVAVDPEGENAIVVAPGANTGGTLHVTSLRDAQPGDVLLVSLEVRPDVVERAVAAVADLDVRVVVNAAPFVRLPQHVLDRCDPVVVKEAEAMALADAGLLPPSLLVTFGERGVAWNGIETPAAPASVVVDTTGAGDAFVGTLAGRLAVGDPEDAALDAALRAAADCVAREGAQPH